MGVKCSSLKINQMYYKIGYVDDPHDGPQISTWIFINKDGEKYYFAEWNSYKWNKLTHEPILTVDFAGNIDKVSGEVSGLAEKDDLIDAIQWTLSVENGSEEE